MNDYYTYRLETGRDFAETERLTREAFWDVYKPGCDEHLFLRNLRNAQCYIRDLAFVCETIDGRIVGACYGSKGEIADGKRVHEAVVIGPIATHPEYRKRGIGFRLLELTFARARGLGYPCAILFGNPEYYRKSGFTDAKDFGIHLADGSDMEAFMCRPLDEESMKRVRGRYLEDPVFAIDPAELEAFDKGFPPREKHKLPGQIFG
jgi:predicted N-acetyltransferase YhbS